MSERPNVVLAALLALAALIGGFVAFGLVLLGAAGVEGMAATAIAAFTACIFFLVGLRELPLSSIVIVLFALSSLGAFVRSLLVYRRQNRMLAALPLAPVGQGELADEAQRAGAELFVFPASRPVAFCVGLRRPRVVLSAGLLAGLDSDEQKAVVWHEALHARSREPLKCLAARLAAQTFFWVPLLRELLERYLLVKELAADREAVAKTSRRALAGALAQVVAPAPAGAVGIAEFAAARVDRLFDAEAALPRFFRPSRLALSALAAGLLVLAVAFPARLGAEQSQEIWTMLTTMSLHGLPGMLLGLAMNVAAFAAAAVLVRRLAP